MEIGIESCCRLFDRSPFIDQIIDDDSIFRFFICELIRIFRDIFCSHIRILVFFIYLMIEYIPYIAGRMKKNVRIAARKIADRSFDMRGEKCIVFNFLLTIGSF